jgi:hypothetical protein
MAAPANAMSRRASAAQSLTAGSAADAAPAAHKASNRTRVRWNTCMAGLSNQSFLFFRKTLAPMTSRAIPTAVKAGWRIIAAEIKNIRPDAISRQPASLLLRWIFKRSSDRYMAVDAQQAFHRSWQRLSKQSFQLVYQ